MSLPYPRIAAADRIQRACFARMSADEALDAMVSGVFDEVPEEAEFPYVTLGEAIEAPDNAHDSYGAKTAVAFHIWSDYRGYLEANTIGSHLQSLFDHQPLEIEGHRLVAMRFRQQTPMRDPNPKIRHVIVRFDVVTEQEAS